MHDDLIGLLDLLPARHPRASLGSLRSEYTHRAPCSFQQFSLICHVYATNASIDLRRLKPPMNTVRAGVHFTLMNARLTWWLLLFLIPASCFCSKLFCNGRGIQQEFSMQTLPVIMRAFSALNMLSLHTSKMII